MPCNPGFQGTSTQNFLNAKRTWPFFILYDNSRKNECQALCLCQLQGFIAITIISAHMQGLHVWASAHHWPDFQWQVLQNRGSQLVMSRLKLCLESASVRLPLAPFKRKQMKRVQQDKRGCISPLTGSAPLQMANLVELQLFNTMQDLIQCCKGLFHLTEPLDLYWLFTQKELVHELSTCCLKPILSMLDFYFQIADLRKRTQVSFRKRTEFFQFSRHIS